MFYPATKLLQTERDYLEALARLEQTLPSARKGTPLGDEFELLSLLIGEWERRNLVIEHPMDPIELIRYAMENRGLKTADLAPTIKRNRASEVLHKKRALTLSMIRYFHEKLQLPLEALFKPYDLE